MAVRVLALLGDHKVPFDAVDESGSMPMSLITLGKK
jgi:hypothetical protein